MTTFSDLIEEVQKPGLCHRCGGCVSFCTAINYAALKLDETGKPVYADQDKCIECGICHMICPAVGELEAETQKLVSWTAPMGRVIETTVAAAADPAIREKGTDGGVVTSLLLHLMDADRIDGAIVSKHTGLFQHQPWLATTREEIIECAGSYFDASQGMSRYGEHYSTFSPSVQALRPLMRKGLRRVALVGVPCQIKTIRKMEALGIVPSDAIHITLGLFCSGNLKFEDEQRGQLENLGGFKWENVAKVNIKDALLITLTSGEVKRVELADLGPLKRQACRFCLDYGAEFADIAFGGIGAPEGWTTVMIRTPKGRAAFADARGKAILQYPIEDNPKFSSEAYQAVATQSDKKKAASGKALDELKS